MSRTDVINIVKLYLLVLNQAGINVSKAYLYGSYARNEATEESDIDLMLIAEEFDTSDDYILSKPWRYTSKIDARIEPVAIGTSRFELDDTSPLIQVVKQEGIEIKL